MERICKGCGQKFDSDYPQRLFCSYKCGSKTKSQKHYLKYKKKFSEQKKLERRNHNYLARRGNEEFDKLEILCSVKDKIKSKEVKNWETRIVNP